ALLVGRRRAQLDRPVRPGQGLVFLHRRLRHQLELRHRLRALPVAGPDAVGPGVAATDHDDVLAGGQDLPPDLVARDDLVLLRKELRREVDAAQFAAGDRQVARQLGTAGQRHRVELAEQLLRRDLLAGPVVDAPGRGVADQYAGAEVHPLGLHLLDAAVDV